MQPQPEFGENRRRPLTGLLGLLAGDAQDDEVIAVPDQRPEPCPVRRPRLVQDMQRDVGEQRRERRTLRAASLRGRHDSALEHPGS